MGRMGPMTPSFLLDKARLEVVKGDVDPKELKFQYNPEQFSLSNSTNWSRAVANNNATAPPTTYRSTAPRSVSLEIFFDRYSQPFGDVSSDVETLFRWTRPCPVPSDNVYHPPALKFRWGSTDLMPDFVGFLSRVEANYTMFRSDGSPVRATCSITLQEIPEEIAGTNPTSGSRQGLRRHVVIEGESLHSVAWAEYGHARYWRALADFNGIDDPLRVAAGTQLLLPSAREAARMS